MVRRIIIIVMTLVLAVPVAGAAVSGAAGCAVKYYYTSEQNPEPVPAATSGVQNGSKWMIRPSGPSKAVYSKNKNGRTMTYSFDGWYTNINCKGTKYPPGKETTSIVPSSSSGRYTVNLYGRWIYSETGAPVQNTTAPHSSKPPAQNNKPAEQNTAAPADTGRSSAPNASSADTACTEAPKKEPGEKENSGKPSKETETKYRGREEALAEWRHILIDTFFYVNDRKYSLAAPGKFWTDSSGNWSGKTGRKGNTQSCITLPTVSLKRTGIISRKSGNIWLSSNFARTPNRTVRRLKRTSSMLTIFYPHKSLKHMAAKGTVKYGDILCRSGHTFVYMGKDSGGHPLIYESGTRRDIGNGTGIIWGHHSGGYANKLTGKINKQISKSNEIGSRWRKGEIKDSAFKGHRASGKNLNKPIHIVCSINTFKVETSCTNGTISPGNTYMAGQDVKISYSPSKGKKLYRVQVDGKDVDTSGKSSSYTFSRINSNHRISVEFK